MSETTFVVDPTDDRFALDEDGYLCRRVIHRTDDGQKYDLGYMQMDTSE